MYISTSRYRKNSQPFSSKFLLLYSYKKYRDLCIVIDILNENEIEVITIIEKSNERRKHDGNKRIRS